MNLEEEIARALAEWRSGEHAEPWEVDMYSDAAGALMPLVRRAQAEARMEAIRGAADAVHAEARWQQELKMRGAVQKSGAETAVERLLVVEDLLRQQAAYFEKEAGE